MRNDFISKSNGNSLNWLHAMPATMRYITDSDCKFLSEYTVCIGDLYISKNILSIYLSIHQQDARLQTCNPEVF